VLNEKKEKRRAGGKEKGKREKRKAPTKILRKGGRELPEFSAWEVERDPLRKAAKKKNSGRNAN